MRTHSHQCAQYMLKNSYKTRQKKHSGKYVLVKNTRVAINFAGMLLVSSEQHMLLLETLKSYDSAVVISKLDVDPQRDDDASPMSTYRCMSKPT